MQQATPTLQLFTLASILVSTYCVSRNLRERADRIELLRIDRGVATKKRVKYDYPTFKFANNAKVKFTPIEPGTLLGMADDGTYLAISDFNAAPVQRIRDDYKIYTYRYFIRYPDGSKKEFIETTEKTVYMGASGIAVSSTGSSLAPATIIRIEKDKTAELTLPSNSTVDFPNLQSDGYTFELDMGENFWFNSKTQSLTPRDGYSNGLMNGSGQFLFSDIDKFLLGKLDSLRPYPLPSGFRPTVLLNISPGTSPRFVTNMRRDDSDVNELFEGGNQRLIPIPLSERSKKTRCIAVSSNGDLLLTDETKRLYLRHQNQWSLIEQPQDFKLGDFYIESYRWNDRTRFVLENGSTLLNMRKNGQNWICKFEVSN